MTRLSEAAHDAGEIRRKLYEGKARNLVHRLKKNFFDAYYEPTCEDAAKRLLSLIPDGAVVGAGDSHTVFALELDDELERKGCRVIPHIAALNIHAYESGGDYGYVKAQTKEEARRLLAEYLTSDVFLLGANAITMNGEIVNVDGCGNRVAGSMYGADRIIVVAGVNKIVRDEAAARERIRFIAAPMDNIKYGDECPCVTTGICANCASPKRICNITTIIHKRPIESDFHVIIVGEELGF